MSDWAWRESFGSIRSLSYARCYHVSVSKRDKLLPHDRYLSSMLYIAYRRGLLEKIAFTCSQQQFILDQVAFQAQEKPCISNEADPEKREASKVGMLVLSLKVMGTRPLAHLIAALLQVEGISRVSTTPIYIDE